MTRHVQTVTTVAVTSAMVTAATAPFAWCFERFTVTEGYRYCAPLVVYGTIWLLVVVFAAGVAWSLAEQVGRTLAKPDPRPTRPPEQPKPEHTPPKPSGPVQPRPPRPTRQVETTLVDMAPVDDVTQEIVRVEGVPVGVRQVPRLSDVLRIQQDVRARKRRTTSEHWRPPVSNNPKERV